MSQLAQELKQLGFVPTIPAMQELEGMFKLSTEPLKMTVAWVDGSTWLLCNKHLPLVDKGLKPYKPGWLKKTAARKQ